MKSRTKIAVVWIVIVITALSMIILGLSLGDTQSSTTPLGLGLGLISFLIVFGLIISVIIMKAGKKYIYDWYPPDKI